MPGFAEYSDYDGLGLAALVRSGEVTPGELLEEAVRRVELFNPHVNAVIEPMVDRAREAVTNGLPDGPFRGVPFLVKDLLADCAGVPSRSGCRFHLDYVPDHDSEIVRRFRASGAVLFGKTNTPEYGLFPVTEPALFGPTRNPWDLNRTPGGSSGGSAAAVATRMVPLAHGNDGGGSIRIPASCCGLFGLKPSRGRNPLGPDMAEAWQGLACDHVLTRSVRDSAAMLDATAGVDPGSPYAAPTPLRPYREEVDVEPRRLRVALSAVPTMPGAVHQDCLRALTAAGELCEALGHDVEEAAPDVDSEAFAEAFLTLVCVETRVTIEAAQRYVGRRATVEDYEVVTWIAGLLGRRVGAVDYAAALRSLKDMARQMGRFFRTYDVLLTPTLASPPVELGALLPQGGEAVIMNLLGRMNASGVLSVLRDVDTTADRIMAFMPFTALANATGQPAMSVPLHWNHEGLPIGTQFVARYGDEATLFRLAGQLERAQPWFDRAPPLCAVVTDAG